MLIFGQVSLIKGQLCPVGLEPPAGARYRKKQPLNFFFNYPRSGIKPESAPDPKFLPHSHICNFTFNYVDATMIASFGVYNQFGYVHNRFAESQSIFSIGYDFIVYKKERTEE